MTITYVLIIVLLLHVYLFKNLIFKWNIFGVFFLATILFSTAGVLVFPFFKTYVMKAFVTFKLELISNNDIIKTQVISLSGLLIVLYAYVLGLSVFFGKIKCIDHFKFEGIVHNNLSRTNYSFLTLSILLFLVIYLFIKRDVLILGIFDGMLGRKPYALIESRRGITSNYLYTIITYNVLPFVTVVSLYLNTHKKKLINRISFIVLFIISFLLILLLFQKRPLIIFLASLFIAGFVFKKKLPISLQKKSKPKQKEKLSKRKYIFYGIFLFLLLILLYYSATTYKFQNVFQAIVKLSEVALSRVFGRLSIPSFLYVHYFPEVDPYYNFSNIGLFSNLFLYEHYPDTKVLFQYFSRNKKDGSLAINTIIDFYGAFGYYGLIFGNFLLGWLLCILDIFLNKLEKNNINLIFTVFCFVFAYYLSQASLARALLGYGFLFFFLTWIFLQKNFKIKLRK